jgi:predicted metal-dependent phosphoesterase TrpH
MSGVELHAHTTASDGTFSPEQAVERALALDLEALAITDHDTMAGVAEARRRAGRRMEIVPGVEISCESDGAPVHLLAYWPDPGHPELGEELAKIRESRRTRVVRMVARLQELGHPITLERVLQFVQRGTPGRPHVARALVEAGVVRNVQEAFTPELIGTGGAAYVPKYALAPPRAVRLVREAGGVPVLAHPGLGRGSRPVPEPVVEAMAAAGLVGLEVRHIDHTPGQVEHFAALAERLGLVPSAGSDCHGDLYRPVRMGRCRATKETLEALRSHRREPK